MPELDLSRFHVAILSALLFLLIAYVAWVVSVSRFSPDSWAYFELSKSVFSDRFYAFNTLRSYFSDSYSAPFPFGLPVVLAIASWPLGADPRGAARRRCYVHFLTNALDHLPRKADDASLGELRWIYDRRQLSEAKSDLAAWLRKWSPRYPKLTGWPEDSIEETSTGCPASTINI